MSIRLEERDCNTIENRRKTAPKELTVDDKDLGTTCSDAGDVKEENMVVGDHHNRVVGTSRIERGLLDIGPGQRVRLSVLERFHVQEV